VKPHYTDEEANDILQRAIDKMPLEDAMSREQLESIATEIGVSVEALRKAEDDIARESAGDAERRAFVSSRRRPFLWHSLAFALVAALLLAFADLSDPGIHFAFNLVFLTWAAALVVHGFRALQTRGVPFQTEFAAWRHRRAVLAMTDEQLELLSRAWQTGPGA
jgi:hypothetical protein